MTSASTEPQARSFGPLGPLALGLSGGGYRAAAFHLGTLQLLERVGLLQDVRALSTVSGGTLIGCRWALALAKQESFAAFVEGACGFLTRIDCIEQALAHIGEPRRTPSKRRSLITAAAEVYARDLLGDATFAALETPTQLEELTFNATEFQSGLGFRFQKSRSAGAVIGNAKYWIRPSAAASLRLADVAAASSCFPGGFEPIAFPDDFVWPGGAAPAEASLSANALGRIPSGFALMDGGIFDNQGLDALLLADDRAQRRGQQLGLVFLSDADQNPALFGPPGLAPSLAREADAAAFHFDPLTRPGWLSFPLLGAMAAALSLAATASAIALGRHWESGDVWSVRFPTVVMGFVAIASPALYLWLRSLFRGGLSAKVGKLWRYLRRQSLSTAKDLAELRARSLFALSSRVFMKRIRSLTLGQLYADAELRQRAIHNAIYDLIELDAAGPQVEADEPSFDAWMLPSASQVAAARTAHEMDTTLWFDAADQLPALLATGQSTTCSNLLDYVRKQLAARPADAGLLALQGKLREAWEALKVGPTA